MTKKRIQEITDFFYSSDSVEDVPLRLSATTGMAGFDFSQEALVELLTILSTSKDLKQDLAYFVEKHG